MKRKRPKVILDTTGLNVPPPTISDLLTSGNVDEVRRGLAAISDLLALDHPLPADVRTWLSEALCAIARGKDPGMALRIKRGRGRPKKYGALYAKAIATEIADLEQQGMSRGDARDTVGRLNLDELALVNRSPADETVRKRVQRARKK